MTASSISSEDLRRTIAQDGRKLLVLDDDPTGVQSVHDVPVLTSWTDDELDWAMDQPASVVFVLTNSRSLPGPRAAALSKEIAATALRAAARRGRELILVSRGDSTLRGHYPAETDALAEAWTDATGRAPDGVILCPAFPEAGRYTKDDVHWVRQGDTAVPVGETEFARDATFGFAASDLREWVAERTDGRHRPHEVVSVGLDDLQAGPERVHARLEAVPPGGVAVVNAEGYDDLERFVAGLVRAERAGRRFIYRCGPSLPRVRGGITPPPPLTPERLFARRANRGHGLVVVGSHVPMTTTQLACARELDGIDAVEIVVRRLLDPRERAAEIDRARAEVTARIAERDVIVFTSREVETAMPDGGATPLDVGAVVSDALVAVVAGIALDTVGWVIAKGGITSSDIGTRGLGVRRATVAGPLLEPGIVPVWILPDSSRAPGIPYVIFPGNVGGPGALADAIQTLRQGR